MKMYSLSPPSSPTPFPQPPHNCLSPILQIQFLLSLIKSIFYLNVHSIMNSHRQKMTPKKTTKEAIRWTYQKPKVAQSRQQESIDRDFPGGAVVKNPPSNAGDTGSIPGPGRSHMLHSNQACVPQLLSLRSRAREPQLLSPRATTLKPVALGPACHNY